MTTLKNGVLLDKFWKKVLKRSPKDCWEWIGAKNSNGYGHMTINKKTKSSHRLSWEIEHGTIPEGLCVLHKCDNRKCVNPNHLFLGTNADNTKDMFSKNRQNSRKGEYNPQCKLLDSEIIEIRRRAILGECKKTIAGDFNISHFYIYDLLNRNRRIIDGTISS